MDGKATDVLGELPNFILDEIAVPPAPECTEAQYIVSPQERAFLWGVYEKCADGNVYTADILSLEKPSAYSTYAKITDGF
eukprot:IDg4124t1